MENTAAVLWISVIIIVAGLIGLLAISGLVGTLRSKVACREIGEPNIFDDHLFRNSWSFYKVLVGFCFFVCMLGAGNLIIWWLENLAMVVSQ